MLKNKLLPFVFVFLHAVQAVPILRSASHDLVRRQFDDIFSDTDFGGFGGDTDFGGSDLELANLPPFGPEDIPPPVPDIFIPEPERIEIDPLPSQEEIDKELPIPPNLPDQAPPPPPLSDPDNQGDSRRSVRRQFDDIFGGDSEPFPDLGIEPDFGIDDGGIELANAPPLDTENLPTIGKPPDIFLPGPEKIEIDPPPSQKEIDKNLPIPNLPSKPPPPKPVNPDNQGDSRRRSLPGSKMFKVRSGIVAA